MFSFGRSIFFFRVAGQEMDLNNNEPNFLTIGLSNSSRQTPEALAKDVIHLCYSGMKIMCFLSYKGKLMVTCFPAIYTQTAKASKRNTFPLLKGLLDTTMKLLMCLLSLNCSLNVSAL